MAEPRASATCEVEIDGQAIACTRDELFAGQPTILQPLPITWGRRGAWDQPDAGSTTFVIRDQRTNPQPIVDTIHVGSKIDVFASAPNPDPQPEVVMDQDFQNTFTAGGNLTDTQWMLESLPATIKRTNRATDPSCTSILGKTSGGSAGLEVSTAWAQFGTTSISIIPNGSSNFSAVFPRGSTGMTAFEAGKTYTVSAYVRLAAPQGGTLNADARRIVFYQATGGPISIVARSDPAPNAAGVHRLSLTYSVPADATQAFISIMNGSAGANDLLWYDGLLIQEGSALDVYFDGASSRTGYTYAWTGTANNSSSTERYQVTYPDSIVPIYDASTAPPGQGTKSAWLFSNGTRARFLFPPDRWNYPWMRTIRPIRPGEIGTYSFMAKLPAGTTARVDTRAFSSSQRDGQTSVMSMDGSASGRVITGTGNWETYTGTVTNNGFPAAPRWPVFAIQVYPESLDFGLVTPSVDAITYTAPPLETERVQVWAGRVTDCNVIPAVGPGTIKIEVTANGEIVEVENVSVGDEPWSSETTVARIDQIAELIPLPVTDFSISRDALPVSVLAPRDVDSQPALALIREYASMVLGVVWPVSVPGARNHVWIENTLWRGAGWTGPEGQLSACNFDASQIQLGQSADQVITTVAVSWLESVAGEYLEQTHYTVDVAAAATYGARQLRLQTEFVSESAASTMGANVITAARASDWSLKGMTFDTKHVNNTDGKAQELLMILLNSAQRPGSWLTITDLPEWMPVSVASGFVEGGTITYTGGRWRFDLNMSAGGTGP